tara:strand:+ start:1031 stop:1342 length:312 start_codon:yes stop_codon:yes gene_type:complete
MKFTQETLHQLISEEIENYLNEQGDDDPMRALYPREKVMANLAKLEAYIEDLEDQLQKRGIDPDGPTVGPTGTQIVEPLATTPVGEKPRRSNVAATRLLDPRN